jgi:hypothetical protein
MTQIVRSSDQDMNPDDLESQLHDFQHSLEDHDGEYFLVSVTNFDYLSREEREEEASKPFSSNKRRDTFYIGQITKDTASSRAVLVGLKGQIEIILHLAFRTAYLGDDYRHHTSCRINIGSIPGGGGVNYDDELEVLNYTYGEPPLEVQVRRVTSIDIGNGAVDRRLKGLGLIEERKPLPGTTKELADLIKKKSYVDLNEQDKRISQVDLQSFRNALYGRSVW